MAQKKNIAVSFTCNRSFPQSIWTNGANQHTFFMYMLLKMMPDVENVWLVSDLKRDELDGRLFASDFVHDMYIYDDVVDQVDLLIEMSACISSEQAMRVQKRGGKLVSYKFGNEYAMSVESMSLGAHKDWVPHPHRIIFDEVWTNEQHAKTCLSFFKHLYRSPVHVMPHVWSPFFINQALANNPETARGWPYAKRGEKARISIFEPNINVVKSTLIPFYAASKFYDDYPSEVSNVYMLNTLQLVDSPLFQRVVMDTEIGRAGIASAEPRAPFVDFIGEYGGIVMTHQWENGLNYLYYEALYGGFPLVHNSPFLKHVGYYYPGFDIDAAAEALKRAWTLHDENLDAYRNAAFAHLKTIDPNSESVINAYAARVNALTE